MPARWALGQPRSSRTVTAPRTSQGRATS
jgi:hypothetical protein